MGKWPMSPICSLLWHYRIIAFCWREPRFKQRATRKNSPFNTSTVVLNISGVYLGGLYVWTQASPRFQPESPEVSSSGSLSSTSGVSLWVSPVMPGSYVPKKKRKRKIVQFEFSCVTLLSQSAIFLSLQWLIGDRDSHCGVICSRTQAKPVCGSDGRNYENSCELQRARCKDKTLTLGHRGRCRGE